MLKKALIGLTLIIFVLGAGGYLFIGNQLYNTLSQVTPGCPTDAENTPANFIVHSSRFGGFDTTPYRMPTFEEIRFPSRQAGINLAGWYVPANTANAPTVIITHGLGSCKHAHSVLIPAGMLHHAGFNVLMFDLRDQGFSDVEDGRTAIGNEEYLDLLGAWDWVLEVKGAQPERTGVFGVSLGAATTLAAFSQEPRVAAAFVDSPFADLPVVIAEELARNNYPTWLAPGGIIAARLTSGDDLLAHSPMDAVRNDAGRPIFVVHGDADTRVLQHHTLDLAALAGQTNANLTTWLPTGVGHVEAMLMLTDEYEQRLVQFFQTALND
ncbi:MAG: prolyl oligopeptidase family serine peptidase [Anaerolineales bacterium]|nr:prolyl oligopeptidase family serine peptidase [Anaerolineales bacterium]